MSRRSARYSSASGAWRGRIGSLRHRAGLALGATLLGLGCRPTSSASTLELWAAGREGEVVAQLMPEFEAQHPGVRVHVQQLPFLGAHEKLLTAVVGESTPDVAQLGNTWIPEFAMIGALEPLDDDVARSEVVQPEAYFEGAWSTSRYTGSLYGVPWYVDTRLLFYRRDLLQQAGYAEPPRTWSEWLAMLKALQAGFDARGERGRTALYLPLNEPEVLLALALQQGEPLLRDGDRFGNFRSQGFQRALEFYVSLFREGLAPRLGNVQIGNVFDEFARGSFVFYISGPWQIGELERRLPRELAGAWATAPMPGPGGPGASLAYGSSLVLFEGSQKKGLGWQLVEYLSRPETQQRFYELTGDLPPRRDTWQRPALVASPHTRAFREQLGKLEPTPAVPEWERLKNEIAIVGEAAARGVMSVPEAAAELDARTDRILEKRRWMLERETGSGQRGQTPAPPAASARAASAAEKGGSP